MYFFITRPNFQKGLGSVSRLASSKMPLPILNNILIETESTGITLAVTDLELGIKTKLPAKVQEKGRFTVPARLLSEFIQNALDDTFEGKVSDDAAFTLTSDHSTVTIRGLDASEFPGLPFIEGEPTFHLLSKDLKEAIDLVIFATAIDDTRPVLSGVLFHLVGQELTVAATDSYRLAEKKLKLNSKATKECSVVVPKHTLLELSRLLADETGDISVFVGDNQIQFVFGLTKLVSRLVEGSYPDYQAILPSEHRTRVTAHLGDFVAGLKTVNLFAREAGNTVKFTFIPGHGMSVQSSADQRGEAKSQITAITEGEELTITFNVKYLLEALGVIQADNVFIELNGPDRPAVLRPANSKEYLSLVMPLKID